MPKNMLYLGVHFPFGRKKSDVFTFILDRILRKTTGWWERYPSKVGKMLMIKAVFKSIPTYVMSCLKLLTFIYNKISSAIRKF